MAWLKDGIDRVVKAMEGEDKQEFWSAYDDCLWRITTSGKAEIEEFVLKGWQYAFETPMPIPLLVIMCRLYVLECKELTPEVELAIAVISAHCSPGEEEGATNGFTHLR